MTIGVGGKTTQQALAELSNRTRDIPGITAEAFQSRLDRLQQSLRDQAVDAVYLHAGTNLYYFTGLSWKPSERMLAAIVPADGPIRYVAPGFEVDTLKDHWVIESSIDEWEEHESPYPHVNEFLASLGASHGRVLLDEATPYFTVDGLQHACPDVEFQSAQPVTQALRSRKSPTELSILQRAHEMTLEVHKATASILRPGISTKEVTQFIDEAHRQVGAVDGSSFCIVLFGVATSFPHGVKEPQILQDNDWVLVDTGCLLHGYNSDITRCYSFGTPTDDQRIAWDHEKAAQLAGFEAAKLGIPCEQCDIAARSVLEAFGYGPGYQVPGLPHRTGHGCGLDIHEAPNLVRGESTPMDEGMVFSCEPMLVLPNRYGVRLEDHFYMSQSGPVWFTEPANSVDDPFGILDS